MNRSLVLHHHRYGTSTYIVDHNCSSFDLPEDLLIEELDIDFEVDRDEFEVVNIPVGEVVTLSC